MKEKILITGGAGYIGSQISYCLSDLGYETVIVENLSTGNKKLINPNSIFYNLDILNTKKISKIIKSYNIKTIFHMAASLSVEESMRNEKKYYINNVEGTKSLLEGANKNIENFIFSSTCAVYGNSKNSKVKEISRINPNSVYGKTKYLSELLITKYSKKNNFKTAIIRYFNVAGSDPKLRSGCINKNDQLIKNLVSRYKKKKYSIDVYGGDYKTKDGTCVRDYIHVYDLARIHIESMNYLINNKKSLLMNCGYGKGYSVLEVIKTFEKISNKKFSISFKNKREGDVSEIISDNSYFKKKLKIKYKNKLEDILKSSLNWELK